LVPEKTLVDRPLSLDEAYVGVQGFLSSSAQWYFYKKAVKRRWARALRLLTIIAVVLGGLAPVAGALWQGFETSIGFILLGLAGGFQVLDRSFGYSAGWSRSLATAMSLEACAAKLALEFSRLKSRSSEDEDMWQLLIVSSNEAWQIISSETSNWLSDFQAEIEDIRAKVETRGES
jgi:hypothetical protein